MAVGDHGFACGEAWLPQLIPIAPTGLLARPDVTGFAISRGPYGPGLGGGPSITLFPLLGDGTIC